MPRRQEQRRSLAGALPVFLRGEQRHLFSRARTARHDPWRRSEPVGEVGGGCGQRLGRIEFQIARHRDAIGRRPERDETLPVRFGPRPDRMHTTERPRQQRGNAPIAWIRAIRDPPRHHDDRHALARAGGDPHRPEFGLHQHERARSRLAKGFVDAPWMIERCESMGKLGMQPCAHRAPRDTRRGERERVAAVAKSRDQARRSRHLAHARSVHPQTVHAGVAAADPFAPTVAPGGSQRHGNGSQRRPDQRAERSRAMPEDGHPASPPPARPPVSPRPPSRGSRGRPPADPAALRAPGLREV